MRNFVYFEQRISFLNFEKENNKLMNLLIITPTIIILSILLAILWIWAIADVFSANFRKKKQRWWWFAGLMLIPVFGMIAYYIWSSKHKIRKSEYAAFFPEAYPDRSSKHLQIVYRDSGMGLRNGIGQVILPPKYPEVKLLGEKLASFSPQLAGQANRKFGLIHHSGEILLPAEFDDIQQVGDSIFIRLGEEVQQFDLDGVFLQIVSAMPG